MKIIQLTEIVKPINNSVKSFNGERLYIATKTLKGNKIEFNFSEKVDYESKPSRANQEVEIGDIIFAKMQGTRKTLLIGNSETDYIFSSGFFVLRTNEKILSEYLYHFLNSSFFLDQKDRNCTGATQKALTLDGLKKIFIPLPSLPQQKQIIQKLDKLTNLIELRKQSIQKTEDLTKSIFIKMFGDIMLNEKGWEIEKLGKVSNVGSSTRVFTKDLVNSGIPFYRGTEISSLSKGENIKSKFFISQEHYNKIIKRVKVPIIGDLLLPSICHDGIIWQVNNNEPFYFKDGRVLWIHLNNTKLNGTYLKFLLKEIFIKSYSKISSGTTFAELKIFILKDLKIPLPNIRIQEKFAKIVQKNEENIRKQKESLVKLEELYGASMQESFSFQ